MNIAFLNKVLPSGDDNRQSELEKKLIYREAEIGGQLFGPIPKGHQRQFFCLDEHTWVWHESWVDNKGRAQSVTTRYDVRPDGVLKVQNGQTYQRLSKNEAKNLYHAVELYEQRVGAYYHRLLQNA